MTTGNSKDSSWLSQEGPEIDVDILMKLYEVYGKQASAALDLHYKNRNYYMIIISALLSILIGGTPGFFQEELSWLRFAIPIIIIFLSQLAKCSMNRYYQRFLESVVILSKIEHFLGLDGPIKDYKSRLSKTLWKDDEQFILKRWAKDRLDYDCSKQFIDARMNEGDNKPSRRFFIILQIMAAILLLLSLLALLPIDLGWVPYFSITHLSFLLSRRGWLFLGILFYLVLYMVLTKLLHV